MGGNRVPGSWSVSPEDYYDDPKPKIEFAGGRFILTGVFAFGTKDDIEKELKTVGGTVTRSPSHSECYVVVGTLPTKDWTTKNAGRKLLNALQLRDIEKLPVHIVGEDYFITALLDEQKNPARRPIVETSLPWEEMLKDWFAPLQQGVKPIYEFYLTKAMVAVHLPGDPAQRICIIRFSPHGPTSIEIPGGYSDHLPVCWENMETPINVINEKRLSQDILHALEKRMAILRKS